MKSHRVQTSFLIFIYFRAGRFHGSHLAPTRRGGGVIFILGLQCADGSLEPRLSLNGGPGGKRARVPEKRLFNKGLRVVTAYCDDRQRGPGNAYTGWAIGGRWTKRGGECGFAGGFASSTCKGIGYSIY
jgi:hypothetical protein